MGAVASQLRRHIVYRGLLNDFTPGAALSTEAWNALFGKYQTGADGFSAKTIHVYAAHLRRWLVFAGLLEIRGSLVVRPLTEGAGSNAGGSGSLPSAGTARAATFLAASNPNNVIQLAWAIKGGQTNHAELTKKYRNAMTDANALGLITRKLDGTVAVQMQASTTSAIEGELRRRVLAQDVMQVVGSNDGDSVMALAQKIMTLLGKDWKPSSQNRNALALRRFYLWATDSKG